MKWKRNGKMEGWPLNKRARPEAFGVVAILVMAAGWIAYGFYILASGGIFR